MRVINFNAGPASLPLEALERARDEFVEFAGSGMALVEHSHRGPEYGAVHNEAIALITEMLGVPSTHQVLFLQGGASLQFALVPTNFLTAGHSADYLLTGIWSERALQEAQALGTSRVAADSRGADGRWRTVPSAEEIKLDPSAAFLHTVANETIDGTQLRTFPDAGSVPLVSDMSSEFMSRAIDVSRFGIIYAGAQKNVGPSGVTVVIIRKDLIERGRRDIPKIFQYRTYAEENSLYNTAPTFSIYLMRNVLAWLKAQGGIPAIESRNREKAALLYGALDRLADFYRTPVAAPARSLMNIVFYTPTPELDARFIAEAKEDGMVGLRGHPVAGGLRVSSYNAISVEQIQTLVSFLERFARKNG